MNPKHQVDHLILLVGSNPLPNAVAGRLLIRQEGLITLLHSAGTSEIAQRLKGWLEKRPKSNVFLKQVDETDAGSIWDGIRERLEAVGRPSVGLNYTGGTKAMSVHAYRALERWAAERQAQPQFSYLDARTLQMVCDPASPESGESAQREYVGRSLPISLSELLQLHDWSLKHDPVTEPTLPKTAEALAVAQTDGGRAWATWIQSELEEKCRPVDRHKWCFRERERRNLKGKELESLRERCKRPERQSDWDDEKKLGDVALQLPTDPSLEAVAAALRDELKLTGAVIPLGAFAEKNGSNKPEEEKNAFNKPGQLCDWLHGKWLEHEVLRALSNPKEPDEKELHLHYCAQNVETDKVNFDVDVVALRGYQLFGFSCSTDHRKSFLKTNKLFEAYVRMRQLGGDEARTALVCCIDNPSELEQEMRQTLVTPHIRVFGRQHLGKLRSELSEWIRSQSGEE